MISAAAGTKRRSQVTGYRAQVTGYRAQVTGHRAQGTGHRSQVTENSIKKLHSIRPLSLLMFIVICFISGYATTRHMFAIVHALLF